MNTTRQYPPIVALLLLRGQNVYMNEMLRLCLHDLRLRNILRITTTPALPVTSGYNGLEYIVQAGPECESYKAEPWERYFTYYFYENPEAKLTLRNYIKLLRSKVMYAPTLYRIIIQDQRFQKLFHQSFWRKIFGGFTLTPDADNIAYRIQAELAQVAQACEEAMAQDPTAGMQLLQSIGTYALLLPKLSARQLSEWLKAIDHSWLSLEQEAQAESGSDGGSDMVILAAILSSTDSHHAHGASHDGGDSGCSGGADSGCSGGGDSGCGGGGCGGGCGGCGG